MMTVINTVPLTTPELRALSKMQAMLEQSGLSLSNVQVTRNDHNCDLDVSFTIIR